jgi:hypothetical protein
LGDGCALGLDRWGAALEVGVHLLLGGHARMAGQNGASGARAACLSRYC